MFLSKKLRPSIKLKIGNTANLKLLALRRIRKFLTQEKAKLLCNAFINSQFNYAQLIWMFCRKDYYEKIWKTHHKALKIVFESNATYEELLEQSRGVSIHQMHLQLLTTEIYKSVMNLNPEFMCSYFRVKNILYHI